MDALLGALMGDFLGTPVYFWVAFLAIVIGLLVFDLGVLHRDEHEISARESLTLYAGYVSIAMLFGAWVWWSRGSEAGLEFYTGYLIEQSLAMDNMFVIATIFGFLGIPRLYQHRVLFWGILGVILFRAILIGVGAALVYQFNWILAVFGAFLIFTGIKMFSHKDEEPDLEQNAIYNFLRRRFRITSVLDGRNFTTMQPDPKTGKLVRFLTPLGVALIMVEAVDLIFAVDSVPAVFAVTQDTFIVYTSNIFAILGLRALYFALAAAMNRFRYLQVSLAIVLVLIGIKVTLVPFGIHLDTLLSLVATISILAGGVFYSMWKTRNEPNISAQEDPTQGQLEP
ncbi:TerC family protein [Tianweitania sediminis]|jgi:tellurite resistance protein TerC|uniref:TerC family protein n=1 Tax=Tianweitania sediminis TaxID=1502156 RepID=A0A8J7R117_9HYPH|nr:TerC family protein [Tianweitania sediminis]MBP0439277.1 TerC family protein [Tianweitania sediminis]HEV7415910.1 TerC family protein [Tianweitania sediminis]